MSDVAKFCVTGPPIIRCGATKPVSNFGRRGVVPDSLPTTGNQAEQRTPDVEDEDAALLALSLLHAPGHHLIHPRPPSAVALLHYKSASYGSPKRFAPTTDCDQPQIETMREAVVTDVLSPELTWGQRTLQHLHAVDSAFDDVIVGDAVSRLNLLCGSSDAPSQNLDANPRKSDRPWATELGNGTQPPVFRWAAVLDVGA